MDGGTIKGVDIESAITQCREIVDDDADIIVDIALCGGLSLPSLSKLPRGAMSAFSRKREIHHYYASSNRVADARAAHPDVQWRSLFLEKEGKLSGRQELDFSNSTTWPAQEQGRKDAQDFLAA